MPGVNDYTKLFQSCDALEYDVLCSIPKATVANTDVRELTVAALTARSLELYRACTDLVRRGMESAARVALRSLLETAFRAVAISKDDEALESYVYQEIRDRKRIVNAARSSGTRLLEELRGSAGDEVLAEAEELLGPSPVREFSTEDYARRAGLHDWYTTAWRSFCWTAHASPLELTQYLILDADGNVTGLTLTPPYEAAEHLVATAALSLIYLYRAFDVTFHVGVAPALDQHERVFAPFVQQAKNGENEGETSN